jgi:hypothetical protein
VRALVGPLLVTLLLQAAPIAAEPVRPGEATLSALIRDARMDEISGMVASRRHPGVLWVHNDSDGPAELFAIDAEGRILATLLLEGAENRDWEDITAFEFEGRHYLMVADTGDNGGLRRQLELAVVAEPELLQDATVPLDWALRFRWPDGPRDTEAVAVDPRDGLVYLISKKRVPPELWRLPLRGDSSDALLVPELLGTLAGVSQPTAEDLERTPVFGRYRSQITAMDISPDGSLMAVLNYRTAYLYPRTDGEDWATAVARNPIEAPYPWLAQAEAIAFSLAGDALWIGTERLPAPLLRMPLQRSR